MLRHAKSSWDNPSLDDFHRPLNERGERDAPRMGKRLRKSGVLPDLICSSSAVRAITTARMAAEELGYTKAIREEKGLYHAGSEGILSIIRHFDDGHETVMIVGHNPGFTDFANELLNEEIGNIPTAGVVGGRLKVDSWKDVKWGCGEMFFYEYPKKAQSQ